MDPTAWNERYAAADLVWSAEPNRFLPPEVAGLAPGRALDVACGEGRNAIWLARQGWDVVAVDFAEAGIAKGRRLAADAGVDVDWVVADVTTFDPPGRFDLVIVFYLQLVDAALTATLRRVAAACAPGATVLVVGHHVDNLESRLRRARPAETSSTTPMPSPPPSPAAGSSSSGPSMVERPVDTDGGPRVALDALVRAVRPALG